MNGQLPVYKNERVLVVGTTSDYIDWIRCARPGQAIFLTDPEIRKAAAESSPHEGEELLCQLKDIETIKTAVQGHLGKWGIKLSGIACFDCESLEYASKLATHFGLPFVDVQSIRNCRDKFISKQIWEKKGVPCPNVKPIKNRNDAIDFFKKFSNGIVLKPFLGSGSELVYRCKSATECIDAFEAIQTGLISRKNNLLFKRPVSDDYLMLAEECIAGSEFSCDFMVDNGQVTVIRKTRKIKVINRPFGTVSGYILSPDPGEDGQAFADLLQKAVTILGIKRSICMTDYILKDGIPYFIELTPRPGGDCIPFLLKEAGGLDILGLTLDFAAGKTITLNGSIPYKAQVGVRIHANKSGMLKSIDTDAIKDDTRVKNIHLIRRPGHRISMPPLDYDSWLLGHIIIDPGTEKYPETSCMVISKRVNVEIQYT